MVRTLLYLIGGALLGGIIHLVVILVLPQYATRDIWTKVEALDAETRMVVLDDVAAGATNPFGLDPELVYGLCRLSLAPGPGLVTGTLPEAFWSVAVFDPTGAVAYSTTNRDGIGRVLDLGLFNPAQTRLLAEQQLDVAEGLLIVETRADDVFVVIRLEVPHPAMRARYRQALSALSCGNIEEG